MAEMLGLVSGGAGIASLAPQLLTSAQAIKGFVADATNAPHRLKTLTYDIGTFGMMLQEFEISPRQSYGDVGVLLDRCITSVRSEVRIIEQHIDRLGNAIKRHRLSGRLRAAFEDPEIQKALDGLERAKTSLLHAHLMYMDCRRTREAEGYQKEVTSRLDQLLSASASPQKLLRSTSHDEKDLMLPDAINLTLPANLSKGPEGDAQSLQDVTDLLLWRRKSTKVTKRQFSIILRSCLSRHICALAISRAALLPTLSLRTWMQGSTSPAFKYSRRGDIVKLRRLLADGQVGPRDRSSAMEGNSDVCLLLMNDYGLRSDFEAINEAITVLVINPGDWTGKLTQYQNMFRLLLERSTIDYDIDGDCQRINSIPNWIFACPNIETLELILRNQQVLNPAAPLFRPDQVLDLDDHYIHRLENPRVLLRLFGITWSPTALHMLPIEIKEHMLHLIAKKLGDLHVIGSVHWDAPSAPWSRTQWLCLVKDLVTAGANPSNVREGKTPLLSMWESSAHGQRRHITYRYGLDEMKDFFDCWIQTMHNAKVDLAEYTELEQQAWSALWSGRHLENRHGRVELVTRLQFPHYQVEKLICGSHPSDCSFTLRGRRIFNVWQTSQVPGSWENSAQNSTCDTIVMPEGHHPGLGWSKIRSISTLSSPVDARQVPSLHYKSMDIRLNATLGKSQDDSGPLALVNTWRRSGHKQSRRGQSSPPSVFRSRQENVR